MYRCRWTRRSIRGRRGRSTDFYRPASSLNRRPAMTISLAPFAAPDIAAVPPTLRAFSVRRLGYACLILIALVSRDAVAQTTVEVTLKAGEYNPSVPVAPGTPYSIRIIAPGLLCSWPSASAVQSAISATDEARLKSFESLDNPGWAMNTLLGSPDNLSGPVVWVQTVTHQATLPLNTPSQDIRVRADCVTLEEARSVILPIRRVIRARLGLPPPTAP